MLSGERFGTDGDSSAVVETRYPPIAVMRPAKPAPWGAHSISIWDGGTVVWRGGAASPTLLRVQPR